MNSVNANEELDLGVINLRRRNNIHIKNFNLINQMISN